MQNQRNLSTELVTHLKHEIDIKELYIRLSYWVIFLTEMSGFAVCLCPVRWLLFSEILWIYQQFDKENNQ